MKTIKQLMDEIEELLERYRQGGKAGVTSIERDMASLLSDLRTALIDMMKEIDAFLSPPAAEGEKLKLPEIGATLWTVVGPDKPEVIRLQVIKVDTMAFGGPLIILSDDKGGRWVRDLDKVFTTREAAEGEKGGR